MKLEKRQPAVILVKCLASPLEGPRAHADKRPHTCQLIVCPFSFTVLTPHAHPSVTNLGQVHTGDQVSLLSWLSLAASIQQSSAPGQGPPGPSARTRPPPSYKSVRRPLRFAGNVGVFNEDSDTSVICTGEQTSLCGTK